MRDCLHERLVRDIFSVSNVFSRYRGFTLRKRFPCICQRLALGGLLALAVLVGLTAGDFPGNSVHGAVVTQALYRLGEDDAGAANGMTATATLEHGSGASLSALESPTYRADGALNGSALSVEFGPGGTNERFEENVLPAGARVATNVGMEAWVRIDGAAGDENLVIGKAGSVNQTGYGLLQKKNSSILQAWIGGARVFGNFDATSDEWTHIAVVIKGSSDPYEFYVDGGLSSTATGGTPAVPDEELVIGGHQTTTGLAGRIDELRIFTFEEGDFDATSDLTLNNAIPEPGPLAFLFTTFMLIALRRHIT